jgi:hypothetical protein
MVGGTSLAGHAISFGTLAYTRLFRKRKKEEYMFSQLRNSTLNILSTLSVFSLLCVPVTAQEPASHSSEVSASFGFAHADGSSHANIGGSGGFKLNKGLAVLADYQYIPYGNIPVGSVSGSSVTLKTVSAHAQLFGVFIRKDFLLKDSKYTPYVLAGAGLFRDSAGTYYVTSSSINTQAVNGIFFGFGGGVSYHIRDKWGIRGELQIDPVHVSSPTTVNNYSASVTETSGTITSLRFSVFREFGKTK